LPFSILIEHELKKVFYCSKKGGIEGKSVKISGYFIVRKVGGWEVRELKQKIHPVNLVNPV